MRLTLVEVLVTTGTVGPGGFREVQGLSGGGPLQVANANKCKLKADRPHPYNYLHTPTNYRHTDNHPRPVMVVVALCCLGGSGNGQMDRQTDAIKCIISLLP